MHELAPGWKTSTLGRLVDIAIGGTPSRDIPRYWASEGVEGFPWVAISDLHARVVSNTKEQITTAGVAHSNVKPVASGTVLMSFKLSLGRMAFAGTDLFTNEAIAAFKSRGEIDEQYLYYVLPEAVRTAATDVAIKGATLNKRSLAALSISHPALSAQKAIAHVLASIDTAIEKTEALIAKHQQIKAGLMHDLFTRGVLPNGQLRPPRSEAPELYRETALGWIPQEWQPLSLRELVGASSIINGPFGSDLLTSELRSEGIPVLYVQDIKPGAFTRVSKAHVTARKANELAFCNVRRGDVLVAKVGDPPCDCCVYESDEQAVVTQDVIRLRPSAEVGPAYLAALLNSDFGRKVVKKISIEGTRERVSLTEFKGLVFPIAHPNEQQRIAQCVVEMQAAIASERTKVSKLQRQKLGLMQDLLTGRVPVPVEEPEPVHA